MWLGLISSALVKGANAASVIPAGQPPVCINCSVKQSGEPELQQGHDRFLVGVPCVRDLLFRAKHLFVAASRYVLASDHIGYRFESSD